MSRNYRADGIFAGEILLRVSVVARVGRDSPFHFVSNPPNAHWNVFRRQKYDRCQISKTGA
jgi:hypothetical protein